jgi:hypothetical protein
MEESHEGGNNEDMPRASPETSTTSETIPPLQNNKNSSAKSCGGIDDVGVNGDNMSGANERARCVQEEYEHEKNVSEDEGLCLLRGGGWQNQYAQPYNKFDCGGIGTTSAEEWGATMPHQDDHNSTCGTDTITPFVRKDWTWILNRVKNWSYNLVFGARGGLIILVIPKYVVCDMGNVQGATDNDNAISVGTSHDTIDVVRAVRLGDSSLTSSDNNHINNPYIMSSGEIEEATILQLVSWDAQTYEEVLLCDQADIIRIHSLNSNTAPDGIYDYVDHVVGGDNDERRS